MDTIEAAALAAYSLFLGVVTGMSGLNLGSARFPAVTQIESSIPISVGTTIGITAVITLATAVSHILSGNIHRKIFYMLTAAATVGVVIGAYFTIFLPSIVIMILIALTFPWSIHRLIRSRKESPVSGDSILTKQAYVRESVTSFGIGSIGGLIGVIPTAILLSSLIHTLKMEPKVIIGTVLAITGVLGVFGATAHLILGNTNFIVLAVMGSAGMIGGVVGVAFTNAINQKKLKTVLIIVQFGVLAFLTSLIVSEILRPAVIHCNSCF